MMQKLLLWVVFMMPCGLLPLGAQTPTFEVSSSLDTVLIGNSITLKFTLSNANGKNFVAPDFEGCKVLSGPHQMSSVMMVNGETSRTLTYTYVVTPEQEGEVVIGEASIQSDGETLRTQALSLPVLPNPDGIEQTPKLDIEDRQSQFFEWRMGIPDRAAEPPASRKKRKTTRI